MSILQLTDLQIVTEALKRLGVTTGYPTAVDGSDTSKYGKLVYPTYQLTRDEEVRQERWASVKKRVQLTPAYVYLTGCTWTSGSTTMTVSSTTGIQVGWVVSNALIMGNPPATAPDGIPAGTTVSSITNNTQLVMSAAATTNGSGDVYFQVDNETGYWFAYEVPDDLIFLCDVFAISPATQYIWPFQVRHLLRYTYDYEAGYIYSDIDNSQGNPIAEYVYEPAAGTPNFTADFCEALIMRLAGKFALYVNQDLNVKKDVNAEYVLVQNRARGRNMTEKKSPHHGENWWRS